MNMVNHSKVEPPRSVSDDKLDRESQFHDMWSEDVDPALVPVEAFFSAATCPENRFISEWLGNVSGLRVLDLGTGIGEAATFFALRGARVTAVDLSEGMLRVARSVGKYHGVTFKCARSNAEALIFKDETFDVVYAANVLHHVDKVRTLDEICRVLKPGGKAAFWDPLVHNPVIKLYRLLAGSMRTEDERPFRMKEVGLFRTRFSRVEHRAFWLFTLWLFIQFFLVEHVSPAKERYWKKIVLESRRLERRYSRLRRWDDRVLARLPWLQRYCWNLVVCVVK